MKVLIRTYGCRANQYDTEAVRAMLAAAGATETQDATDADFAIFNSCTVTASAEADLRSDVRAASRLNPELRAVVMGCAAALPSRDESVAPLRTLPGVEAVVGGADLAAIAAAIGLDNRVSDSRSGVDNGTPAQTGARALLRIQDGCDEHCTFCATTLARGANRSRSIDDLVREAGQLAGSHPEIVLTGIHIGTYGRDNGSSLGVLVSALIDRVPRVRFRLSSVEATEVDDRLAALLTADATRLAPHLHAPLQSGSDSVLRRMGRNWYDSASYETAIRRIVPRDSVFALSADIIAGFPGESDLDHLATMRMVERLPFTSLHVFPYSPRPGTGAARLGMQVTPSIARRRSQELRDLADEKGARHRAARGGGDCDVVVTERGKGLTEDYLSVAVDDVSLPRRSRFVGTLQSMDGRLTASLRAQSLA
ncbi:MAG: MiaB/RimO family radical SAM methylthiotransferase [Gemmatimonadales bacterium]